MQRKWWMHGMKTLKKWLSPLRFADHSNERRCRRIILFRRVPTKIFNNVKITWPANSGMRHHARFVCVCASYLPVDCLALNMRGTKTRIVRLGLHEAMIAHPEDQPVPSVKYSICIFRRHWVSTGAPMRARSRGR